MGQPPPKKYAPPPDKTTPLKMKICSDFSLKFKPSKFQLREPSEWGAHSSKTTCNATLGNMRSTFQDYQ